MKRHAVRGNITVDGKPVGFGSITFLSETFPNAPAAVARIRNGKYQLPETEGPVGGLNKVRVCNLGSVEPRPTIEEVEVFKATIDTHEGNRKMDFGFREP